MSFKAEPTLKKFLECTTPSPIPSPTFHSLSQLPSPQLWAALMWLRSTRLLTSRTPSPHHFPHTATYLPSDVLDIMIEKKLTTVGVVDSDGVAVAILDVLDITAFFLSVSEGTSPRAPLSKTSLSPTVSTKKNGKTKIKLLKGKYTKAKAGDVRIHPSHLQWHTCTPGAEISWRPVDYQNPSCHRLPTSPTARLLCT